MGLAVCFNYQASLLRLMLIRFVAKAKHLCWMCLQEGSLRKSSVFEPPFLFPLKLCWRTASEPTVFENYVHDIYVDDNLVELSLWDTAGECIIKMKLFANSSLFLQGQEEFDRLRSLSYAETHVVMICFSVDNPVSLENVESKVCQSQPLWIRFLFLFESISGWMKFWNTVREWRLVCS